MIETSAVTSVAQGFSKGGSRRMTLAKHLYAEEELSTPSADPSSQLSMQACNILDLNPPNLGTPIVKDLSINNKPVKTNNQKDIVLTCQTEMRMKYVDHVSRPISNSPPFVILGRKDKRRQFIYIDILQLIKHRKR